MLKERVKSYILLLLFSLSIHVFVYIDYKFISRSINLPVSWHTQFYILLLFSLFLSVLLTFIGRFRPLFIALKFILLQILGYPLGSYLGIETTLLICLVLETVYYLSVNFGTFISGIIIIITFFNQKSVSSWGDVKEQADIHQLLFFLFISLLVLVISSFFKRVSIESFNKSRDISRLDFAVKELTEINLDYQNYAASVEQDSIEKERKRISREMHDIIGYTLTNQLMIIQAVLSMKDLLPREIETLLLQSQKQTKEGMAQARSALHKLREYSPEGDRGLKLIYKMVKTFGQITGIDITIDFCNTPDSMGNDIDRAIYRIVQEGLTNAFRHGKATKISIVFSVDQNDLVINIWDNGVGAEKIDEGIGLKGMRERIDSLNGSFETSLLQNGFTLKARIPLSEVVLNETVSC